MGNHRHVQAPYSSSGLSANLEYSIRPDSASEARCLGEYEGLSSDISDACK